MSIISVHFSLPVTEVDRKKKIPEPQSGACSFIDRTLVLRVPACPGAQEQAARSWRQAEPALRLCAAAGSTAVNRDTRRSSRVHPASACLDRPGCPTLLGLGSTFPLRKLLARGGCGFVGARGARLIGRQHCWALELSKTQKMQACGIRAAFSKRFGGLRGLFVCSPV